MATGGGAEMSAHIQHASEICGDLWRFSEIRYFGEYHATFTNPGILEGIPVITKGDRPRRDR
eukprot:1328282-Amorphochlora_amoeboformis.AAC.1